jgi:serine/threonine protein kinase
MTHVLALPAGTDLAGDYRIERVLGAGGFGITYLADELALARPVTIKEYFPIDYAVRGDGQDAVPRSQDCSGDYQWGLDRFIEEAQTLARFDHPNIVRVYRYFRANNTGYMVLQFEEGKSLKGWLKALGRAPRQKELDQIVAPLLDSLELIHKHDFLHRDIAPDNVIIRTDGSPVLIDFGSARGDIARHSRTVSALVKPGYSPYEQYAEIGEQQGAWTDIYALGATLYHVVTGKRPPDAPSRVVKDEMVPVGEAALSSYRAGFLAAIDRALMLDIGKRPQSVAEWRGNLLAPDPVKPGWLQRTLRRKSTSDEHAPAELAARSGPRPMGEAVPPPPDAPGAKGGLLDYIEGLKRKVPAPAPSKLAQAGAQTIADAVAEPPAPRPKPAAPKDEAKVRDAKVATEAPPPRLPVITPRKPPRTRAIRYPERRSWRPLMFKLLVGAGVATAAVGLQDQFPRLEVRGSGIVSSAAKEPASISQVRGHNGGARGVAFTDDGRWLVTSGADGTVKVWDAASGGLLRTIVLEEGPATALAVLGRRAVTGHTSGAAVLWDLDRGERVALFRRNEANIWSVGFAGDPAHVLTASHDWAITLWSTSDSVVPLNVFEGHESAAQAVAYSARGPFIASGSADRTVKLWSPSTLSVIRTYRGNRDFVTNLAFSPDGKILASASLEGGIRLWSTSSHRLYRVLAEHKGRIGGLAFSPSGEFLASSGEDGTVRLWDFRRGRTVRIYGSGGPAVKSLAFSPDGRRIAAASEDGQVRLWDARRGLQQTQ